MNLKSVKQPPKPDVWVTEIRVKPKRESEALNKLIGLVRKYEALS